MQPEAGGGTLLHGMSRQHLPFLLLVFNIKTAWLPVSAPIRMVSFLAFFFFFYSGLVPHYGSKNQLQQDIFLDYFLSLPLFGGSSSTTKAQIVDFFALILSTRAPPATRTNKCSKSLKCLEVALPRPFPSPTQCLWCSRVRPRTDHTWHACSRF